MAEIKLLRNQPLTVVIDDNATLANTVRAAADYDNSVKLDLGCDIYLQVQYDATAPAAGDKIAELYILPGDGEVSEVFPEGGDAGLGTDVTPQAILLVGAFESRSPSITVDEILSIPGVPLYGHTNRFVILNTSGQIFDSTWQVSIKPYKLQSV